MVYLSAMQIDNVIMCQIINEVHQNTRVIIMDTSILHLRQATSLESFFGICRRTSKNSVTNQYKLRKFRTE